LYVNTQATPQWLKVAGLSRLPTFVKDFSLLAEAIAATR